MLNVCFQVSTFFIEAVDLGDLRRLVVEKSSGTQWHLSQIAVKKGSFAPKEDVFQYDRYVTRVTGDRCVTCDRCINSETGVSRV